MTTPFENRALPLISRGIPVFPLPPRSKAAKLSDWQNLASTDHSRIKEWSLQGPEDNCAAVAQACAGGFWFLDIDRPDFAKTIEEQTGQKIPPTMMVRSQPGKGHFYFRQTPKSIEMGNAQAKDDQGELWSARVDNRYVVGPGSVHPASGREYELIRDVEIVPAPDWLVEWCSAQRVAKPVVVSEQPSWVSAAPGWVQKLDAIDGDFAAVLDACPGIHEGGRNQTLASVGGKLHVLRWTEENVLYCLNVLNRDRCSPSLPGGEVDTIAHSVCRYQVPVKVLIGGKVAGYAALAEQSLFTSIQRINPNLDGSQLKQLVSQVKVYGQSAPPVEDEQVNASEMLSAPSINYLPESCFTSTRLSDIYNNVFKLHEWPIELALPALATAASVTVPRMVKAAEKSLIVSLSGDDPLVNLYTALLAPINTGKSSVIEWAATAVGIYKTGDVAPGDNYHEVKYGSAEQMIKSLGKKQENFLNRNVLVNPDEWSHLLSKASIPDASFPKVLTTMFYKRQGTHTLGGVGGGREIQLNLAVSLIGGIVEDEFDTVFGAGTLGGLYDRFLFGRAPDGFKWAYRPCPVDHMKNYGAWKSWNTKSVVLNGSVFEVIKSWATKYPSMGRMTEVCTRVGTIFASVDGRGVLTGRDLEALEPLALYQVGLRQQFRPSAALNLDAHYANKALAWVNTQAVDWTVVSSLKRALQRLEESIGPVVADRALKSLAYGGRIDLWLNKPDQDMPPDYHGRRPKIGLVRRVR